MSKNKAPASAAVAPVVVNTHGGKAAPHIPALMGLLKAATHVKDIAAKLNITEPLVRQTIDLARSKGLKIDRVAKCTFQAVASEPKK